MSLKTKFHVIYSKKEKYEYYELRICPWKNKPITDYNLIKRQQLKKNRPQDNW